MIPSPRSRHVRVWAVFSPLAAAALGFGAPSVVLADTIVLRDETQMEGTVLDLNAEKLRLRKKDGAELLVPRERIARILFEPPLPPLKVEVRSVLGDDEFSLLVNGDPVIEKITTTSSGWIDVSSLLRHGNNELRPRVGNEYGSWAFRWDLRINGRVKTFACGEPGIRGKGCSCCGLRGDEKKTIESIDPVWLYVDRAVGKAEIVGQ